MKIGTHTRELLGERKFRKALVHFFIDNGYFRNVNRFKIGDQVRYNWKAKISIWSAIDEKWGQTFVVTKIWANGQNVDYYSDEYGEGGCDVFWLRPARKSERILTGKEAEKDVL